VGKIVQSNNAEPTTPSSGSTAIYVDSATKKLTTKDDAGTVTNYGTGGGADELVKVSVNDTTASFLESKILAGEGISLVKGNAATNETLTIRKTPYETEVQLRPWYWFGNSTLNSNTPLSFSQINSGSGSGVTVEAVTVESDIARAKINGGIGANAYANIYAGLPSAGQMLFDQVERIYTYHVRVERLGTGSSDKIIHHLGGFTNSRAVADPLRWMGPVYESNVSPNFILRTTGPGSASTSTITDVPVVADQKYKLTIRYFNNAGTRTAELYIDDVLKATNTTNLPATTEALGFLHKAKSLDGTAEESAFSLVDWASFKVIY